jgi:phospholipase A1/A2
MSKIISMLVIAVGMTLPLKGHAKEDWLVISNSTLLNAGEALSIEVIKPESATWPESLMVELSGAGASESIVLIEAPSGNSTLSHRRSFQLTPSKQFAGLVKARLADVESNQFLLIANSDAVRGSVTALVEPHQELEPVDSPFPNSSSPQIVIAKPGDEPALSAHEPTYIVFGDSSDRGFDARYQLSFKYRIFDPEGFIGRFSPLFSNLYFSYTQTSLWDIGEDSSPFRDTSYRPGLFYQWAGSDKFLFPDEWRVGAEHESNGRSDVDSRSIDTAYISPSWHIDLPSNRRFSFTPKIYTYIDKNENNDIQRYRGYVDWMARFGREDGLMFNGLYRQGTAGYATGQLDISYPISERIFARTGSFVHLQLFSGYGETLLDYDQDRDSQIRLGISIAR